METHGIRVEVRSRYLEAESNARTKRYAFAYSVRIRNQSTVSTQLLSRHWIITDANGKVQEVRGGGVVGEYPILHPGGVFEYTSGAVIETSHGEMRGSYRMHTVTGQTFDAVIAPFLLCLPYSLN